MSTDPLAIQPVPIADAAMLFAHAALVAAASGFEVHAREDEIWIARRGTPVEDLDSHSFKVVLHDFSILNFHGENILCRH